MKVAEMLACCQCIHLDWIKMKAIPASESEGEGARDFILPNPLLISANHNVNTPTWKNSSVIFQHPGQGRILCGSPTKYLSARGREQITGATSKIKLILDEICISYNETACRAC